MLLSEETSDKIESAVKASQGKMSPMFTALCGYFTARKFTEPQIEDVDITSDGFVLARQSGDIGFNAFIGSAADYQRNVHDLALAANLTLDEMTQLYRVAKLRVPTWVYPGLHPSHHAYVAPKR